MIDVLLLVLIVAYAASGFRQGIAVGALSLAGFVGGAALAMWLAPVIGEYAPVGVRRALLVLAVVLVLSWTGQLLGSWLGGRIRKGVARAGARGVDQVLGAVAGAAAVALVAWFVGDALRQTPVPGLAKAVASSRVLSAIDRTVPPPLRSVASNFRSVLSDSAFPRVFEGVSPEEVTPVDPPVASAVPVAVQRRVRGSVVKITGDAPACKRGQEGSGAVFAAQRVVTNAHVVAGVRNPTVQLAGGGRRYPALVVLFDPKVDLAVLAVPDLTAPALRLGTTLERGDDALVAGYPGNGPYTATPARVRSVIKASGEDIYGRSGAVRQVYSLFTTVEQGNSGGPVVGADGALAGVVFAKSLDDPATGYALTLDEVRDELAAGQAATAAVGTGKCTTD